MALRMTMLTTLLATLTLGCATMNTQANPNIIDYQRSGGIRGLNDHLTISEDGSAQLARKAARSEFALDRSVLTEVRDVLGEIDFAALKSEYLPSRPGADMYEYIITHDGHTVRAVETALPSELRPLVDLLNRIIDGT